MGSEIEYRVSPSVDRVQLNALLADAWSCPQEERDLDPNFDGSLGYVCAYRNAELVGFVNISWDGAYQACLVDLTVRSDLRRQGIGRELVRRAVEVARGAGCMSVHIGYESRLAGFYRKCGFS
jgi:GNAT superfamily N-acetyltransferase